MRHPAMNLRSCSTRVPWVLTPFLLGTALTIGLAVSALRAAAPAVPTPSPTVPGAATEDLATLRGELERLKSLVPDQAHVMQDVAYHFANLWFAGEQKNWPLADFYLGETRSHLKWAVRTRPVRPTKAGDLALAGILDAIDGTLLKDLKQSIDDHDTPRFGTAYRAALEGCYSCHKAAEKPYLRPRVPLSTPEPLINPDPQADWPR